MSSVPPVIGGVMSATLVVVAIFLWATERVRASLAALAVGVVVLVGGFATKGMVENALDSRCRGVVPQSPTGDPAAQPADPDSTGGPEQTTIPASGYRIDQNVLWKDDVAFTMTKVEVTEDAIEFHATYPAPFDQEPGPCESVWNQPEMVLGEYEEIEASGTWCEGSEMRAVWPNDWRFLSSFVLRWNIAELHFAGINTVEQGCSWQGVCDPGSPVTLTPA